jgi:hypothetical protein
MTPHLSSTPRITAGWRGGAAEAGRRGGVEPSTSRGPYEDERDDGLLSMVLLGAILLGSGSRHSHGSHNPKLVPH